MNREEHNKKEIKGRDIRISFAIIMLLEVFVVVITTDLIIRAAALIGALGAIGALVYKVIVWIQVQQKQSEEIEKLKKEARDINTLRKEQYMVSYAIFACLDGLKQQGCNGAVTEAYNKMQDHLNAQAHVEVEEED